MVDITRGSLVGRNREFDQLVSAYESALGGRPRIIVLAGEPGIGKSLLLNQIAEQSQQSGGLVLNGQAYDQLGSPAYWPWITVLREYVEYSGTEAALSSMSESAPIIAGLGPEIRRILPGIELAPQSDNAGADQFRMFDAFARFLVSASAQTPLTICLEDLHWADHSTLSLMEFLPPAIAGSRILIAATTRTVDTGDSDYFRASLGRMSHHPMVERIELGPLSLADTEKLVQSEAGRYADKSTIRQIFRVAEGNPFFTIQIARILKSESVDSASAESQIQVPEVVREVVSRRLSTISDNARNIMTVASVLGIEFTFEQLLLLATGHTENQLLGAIDEALRDQIIEEREGNEERYRFAHALIHRSLYESMSVSRRARRHADATLALESLYSQEADNHGAELLFHLGAAGSGSNVEKIVHYSVVVGEEALASYAWQEAIAHFERALAIKQEQIPDEQSARVLYGLGRAQLAQYPRHRRDEPVKTLEKAFDAFIAAGLLDNAVEVAQVNLVPVAGRTRFGTLIERSMDLVDPDSIEAGRLLCRYGHALNIERGEYDRGMSVIGDADRIAELYRDEALALDIAVCRLSLYSQNGSYPELLRDSAEVIERAGRLKDTSGLIRGKYFLGFGLVWAGRLPEAVQNAEEMLTLSEAVHDSNSIEQALQHCVKTSVLAGDWQSASRYIERGLEISQGGFGFIGEKAHLAFELGDNENGQRHLETLYANRSDEAGVREMSLAVAASGLITGDQEFLDAAAEGARNIIEESEITELRRMLAKITLAMIAVTRGDSGAATVAYQELKTGGQPVIRYALNPCTHRLLGQLAFTANKPDAALIHLEDALQYCRDVGYLPELAWTCHEFATLLVDEGNVPALSRAGELIDEGLSVALNFQMKPLIAKFRMLESNIAQAKVGKVQHPGGLTEREMEVLRLVAEGRSNREIAEALFISQNTVIRHVSNLMSKTGSANRTEAGVYAERNGLTGER